MKKSLMIKIRSLIRRARVSLSLPDTGTYPIVQIEYLGKTANMEVIWPYGMGGQLPEDAQPICFNVEAMEENKAGIGTAPLIRFKVDAEGETWFGNPKSGSVVYFRENGDIEIIDKNDLSIIINNNMDIVATSAVNITAPVIGLTGNTTLTGNVIITGTLTVAGKDFITHIHSGVTTGPGNTGAMV